MTKLRRRPYGERSIKQAACCRCGSPARYQWSACAVDNQWMALCPACDVGLNEVALAYVLGGRATRPLIRAYRERVEARA